MRYKLVTKKHKKKAVKKELSIKKSLTFAMF